MAVAEHGGTSSSASTTVAGSTVSGAALRWLGMVWFSVAVMLGVHALSDNSFLTHLATGRLILDGKLPHVDPYSFTAAGRPWVVQSWLASVIDAGIERVGGLGALRWFCGLLMGLLVALIWRLTRPAGDALARCVTMTLAAATGVVWWGERPQMLAFVLMGLALVVVTERRSSWWLAPIFAIWINVHASWPVGLIIVGTYLVIGFVHGPRSERGFVEAVVTPALIAASSCVVGALVSPYGSALLRFPLDMAKRTDVLQYILEWRAPKLFAVDTIGVALIVVIALVGAWRSRQPLSALLVLAIAAMSAVSARNIAVGAVALVPLVASALNGLGSMGRPESLGRRPVMISAAAALVAGAILISFTAPHVNLESYPAELIDRLEAKGWVATSGVHVITHDYVGNYLTYRYGDAANVFVDDRAELYPFRVAKDDVDLIRGARNWRSILDRYDADVVLWSLDSKLARGLEREAGWRSIGQANGFGAWCRVSTLTGC